MVQVKTFVMNSGNPLHHDRLAAQINKFIAENNVSVIDIKYSTSVINTNYWVQSAMLIYQSQNNNN